MLPELPKNIANNIEHFAGRRWLLPDLLEWLAKPDERMFILTGDPGTGKSMITAWLAGYGPMPTDSDAAAQLERIRQRVKASHFCMAASRSNSPLALAEKIAKQLAGNVRGFGDALAVTLAERVHLTAVQQVQTVAAGGNVTGIYIERIDLSNLGDELSFDRAFTQPIKKLYADGYKESILLLVDSLDEAQTYTGSITLAKLLAKLVYLPKQVRILATTRPDPRVLKYFLGVKRFDLIEDAPKDVDDVREYVMEQIADLHPVNADKRAEFADHVSQATQGIFLYAYMVLSDLWPGFPNLPDFERYPLPIGLSGLYHEFLNRELGKDEDRWYGTYKPLLGLITVSYSEGLTRNQLQQMVGKDLEQALRACKQYLIGDLPDGPFRPFHRSFVDFLLEDKENIDYHIDALSTHRQIVDYYRGKAMSWETIDWSNIPPYALLHLAAHLFQLREAKSYRDQLHNLLETRSFIDQHLAILGKPSLLLDDLRLALNLALENDDLAWAWRHIREFRRITRDQLDFERLLRVVEKGNKTGDYVHVIERTNLYGYMPNSQALTRLWIAWNAAASGHTTVAESIMKDALERLPPRDVAHLATRQAGGFAVQAVKDIIGETLQRLLIRISQAAEENFPFRGWLRDAMSPWPTSTVDDTVKRLSEPLTSWGEIFDAEQMSDTMEELFQELQGRGGRLNASIDIETMYAFLRRLSAGLFNSRNDPVWLEYVKRYVALVGHNDYPDYREMALAWVAAAVLAQEDSALARQALAIVLGGMFRPSPGFWGDTVASAMDGMERESNQRPDYQHLLGLLEHMEATVERGIDPTVYRKMPEIMEWRYRVGLPDDPWSFGMRRRSAVAAVGHRRSDDLGAEAILQKASAERPEESYAGYRALASLSLACRLSRMAPAARSSGTDREGPRGR